MNRHVLLFSALTACGNTPVPSPDGRLDDGGLEASTTSDGEAGVTAIDANESGDAQGCGPGDIGFAGSRVVACGQCVGSIKADGVAVYWVNGCLGPAGPELRRLAKNETTVVSLGAMLGGAIGFDEMAVDGGDVYLVDAVPGSKTEDQILRFSVAGERSVIASESSFILAIALDGTYAYWHNGKSIKRMPRAGGPEDVLVDGVLARTIAVDGTHVYWLEANVAVGTYDKIFRAPLAGGQTELVIDMHTISNDAKFALDATNVYWKDGDGGIYATSKQGGTPKMLASGRPSWNAFGVDSKNVYWGEFVIGDGGQRSDAIFFVPLSGGAVGSIPGASPGTFALDDQNLFFLDDEDARIFQVGAP